MSDACVAQSTGNRKTWARIAAQSKASFFPQKDFQNYLILLSMTALFLKVINRVCCITFDFPTPDSLFSILLPSYPFSSALFVIVPGRHADSCLYFTFFFYSISQVNPPSEIHFSLLKPFPCFILQYFLSELILFYI